MAEVRDENTFTICGWMVKKLGLKGSDLQVYAIIHGFSQDGESLFYGSLKYLSDFTGLSRTTIITSLNNLVESNLIIKIPNEVNGIQLPRYKVNLQRIDAIKNRTTSTETVPPSTETVSHNKVDNISINTIPSKDSIVLTDIQKNNTVEETSTSCKQHKKPSLINCRKPDTINSGNQVQEVVDYLNKVSGKNYRADTGNTVKLITGRLKDGYTVDDMKRVIDNQFKLWGSTDMKQYLRPSTLFRPSNFENYYNNLPQQTKRPVNKGTPHYKLDLTEESF